MIATPNNPFSRLKRGIQRYGVVPSLKRFVLQRFNRLFRARLCVWEWRHGEPLYSGSESLNIQRYDSADELSPDVLTELLAGDAPGFAQRMHEEFSGGGVLWVGDIDGRVAGYQWSRRGNSVENWHIALGERDVLIYSTVTFHDFRGRSVAPTMMARICEEEVPAEGNAYSDCMVWNTPAVRFIRKVGFRKVAERKPLAGHPD